MKTLSLWVFCIAVILGSIRAAPVAEDIHELKETIKILQVNYLIDYHLLNQKYIVTVRNSSSGKVMFSQAPVCPQGGGVHPPGQTSPGETPPTRMHSCYLI